MPNVARDFCCYGRLGGVAKTCFLLWTFVLGVLVCSNSIAPRLLTNDGSWIDERSWRYIDKEIHCTEVSIDDTVSTLNQAKAYLQHP